MKKHIFLLIILTILLGQAFGQTDTASVYKGLEKKKFYIVDLSQINGGASYALNGKPISKATYDRYMSVMNNIETCRPCILECYNENEVLLSESVHYSDCCVGSFKDFYPNGKVKLSGRFKENPTGNWEHIAERGYCNVPDGEWTYFNPKGPVLYSEFWKDGEFIKQVPEQKKTEIWKVDVTLNGEKLDKQLLTIEQIKELIITPKFKNGNRANVNLTVKLTIIVGNVPSSESFSIENFKTIDVAKILSDITPAPDNKVSFSLRIFNNGDEIESYQLNVAR